MRSITVVNVFQREEELFDDAFGFLFPKLTVGLRFQMSVQAFSVSVLHDEIDILRRINTLMQLDNIRMVQS